MLKSYWAELKLDPRLSQEMQSMGHFLNVESMELSIYINLESAPPQAVLIFFPLKCPESFYLAISAETLKNVYDYIG